jgi:hypothetical protein
MSLLGNGDSLPLSEAKNSELLLLEETKRPRDKASSKGILSSLFKSAQLMAGGNLTSFDIIRIYDFL